MNLKETIRKVLREEISEAYYKPTEKIDNLINGWLDKLFLGSTMYYDKLYEYRHDFVWCNNGLEIAHIIMYLDNNENVYSDKRPATERKFKKGDLMIPKSIIDDLTLFVPIRRNYLKYKIEEWFEDNLFQGINEKLSRNDMHIDEIIEHPKNAQVCVPPVEKPEDVTQDEMIEFVYNTTAYRKDELIQRAKEEPSWIENLYLRKLRDEKIEELRN